MKFPHLNQYDDLRGRFFKEDVNYTYFLDVKITQTVSSFKESSFYIPSGNTKTLATNDLKYVLKGRSKSINCIFWRDPYHFCSVFSPKDFRYLKLKWRYSPIKAVCKAYGRESTSTRQPHKVQYRHFRFLKPLVMWAVKCFADKSPNLLASLLLP